MPRAPRTVAPFVCAALILGACSSESLNPGDGRPPAEPTPAAEDPAAFPFEPVGPSVYVPKVKNLLTGLPATDEEVQAVVKDANALRGLIDGWMTLPSFKTRMLDFLRNAFQQNQVDIPTLATNMNVRADINETIAAPQLARNLMDSFPLTVWKLLEEGKPFTESFTTRRYMMTTAMLATISYFDEVPTDDQRRATSRLSTRSAIAGYTFDSAGTATIDDAFDPLSPSFMKFKTPATQPTGCTTTTIESFLPTGDGNFYARLYNFMMGKQQFNPCKIMNAQTQRFQPVFRDEDWSDWRMVEVKVDPATPASVPAFYELQQLRLAETITVATDRLGYFGTPAFAANWATNPTNDGRVIANQALIVGIGQSIAGENAVVSFPVDATEASHAADPRCQGCHVQLDPFKQFFRQSYSLYWHRQRDAKEINAAAGFSIDGVTDTGSGVGSVAGILAKHPRLPLAWTAKLHFWASSTPVIETDPEAIRIADAFTASRFDFRTLVRELFSSPLITWASGTLTTRQNGVIVSIARRDQFCASLSYRLGLDDVCGMLSVRPSATQRTIASRATLLPVDTYYRSFALPSLPTNPDLFFRQSTESICRLVADQVVDVKAAPSKYTSADAPAAIDDLLSNVMGLVASDPRREKAKAILVDNFDAAKAAGANPTDALKSTFSLACLSPTSVIVGL